MKNSKIKSWPWKYLKNCYSFTITTSFKRFAVNYLICWRKWKVRFSGKSKSWPACFSQAFNRFAAFHMNTSPLLKNHSTIFSILLSTLSPLSKQQVPRRPPTAPPDRRSLNWINPDIITPVFIISLHPIMNERQKRKNCNQRTRS